MAATHSIRSIGPNAIVAELRRHPRITYQELIQSDEALERLRNSLLPLVPFGDAAYHDVLAILDWDHRLPSRVVILRIYAYYSARALQRGIAQLKMRSAEIDIDDKFPEFDVPDYSGLAADEAYEADLEPDGTISKIRLTSPWRRDIDAEHARTAVRLTRESEQFKQMLKSVPSTRPDHLGDLEALAWTPPCETQLDKWTLDVWYLLHLDTATGKGHSFLVDLDEGQVVGTREFIVQAT